MCVVVLQKVVNSLKEGLSFNSMPKLPPLAKATKSRTHQQDSWLAWQTMSGHNVPAQTAACKKQINYIQQDNNYTCVLCSVVSARSFFVLFCCGLGGCVVVLGWVHVALIAADV